MNNKTPDILKKIITRKREEVTEAKARISLAELIMQVQAASPVRGFVSHIQSKINRDK